MVEAIRQRGPAVWTITAALVLLSGPHAVACPIPVFQFALEFWRVCPYEVVIHHNGELEGEHQAAADLLKQATRGEDRHANIRLIWRDYSRATISPPADVPLPFMELRYPSTSGIRESIWRGPLEENVAEQLLHSPMRQKIAETLLDRHAAVWVLLESGNRREDGQARKLLEQELPRLEKTLKVPDPAEEYGLDSADIYTEIDFTLMTLSRNDPEERMLVQMLLGSERDLKEYEDKPMVFPIYGRGRVMYAIVGDGINAWTLNAAGEFLTGPCSCMVKAQNPGVDLLTSFDWESQVEQRSTYAVPYTPTAGGFLDRIREAEERIQQE
ncbi:MAG: hypothetical protein R6X33_06360 [Candidatus Brocadiia bacterium]